jgi:hypothetical protein
VEAGRTGERRRPPPARFYRAGRSWARGCVGCPVSR